MRKALLTLAAVLGLLIPAGAASARTATPAPIGPHHCHLSGSRIVCDAPASLRPAQPGPIHGHPAPHGRHVLPVRAR